MKNTLMFLILFIACQNCFGADENIYVDPAWAGTESGTEAEPYNTIQEAVDAATSTGSDISYIHLKDGTYSPATQGTGWRVRISTGESGENIYIQSSDEWAQRILTFDTTNPWYAFDIGIDASSVKLKDLNFGDCAKNALLTVDDQATGCNITLDNVTCAGVATASILEFSDLSNETTVGDINIFNCSLTGDETNGNSINLRHSCGLLNIYNSILDQTDTASISRAILFSDTPAIGGINIVKSTLKGGYSSLGDVGVLTSRVYLEGSHFETYRTDSSRPNLLVGAEYNTYDDWADSTAYSKADIKQWDGWVYECLANHTSSAATDEPGAGTDWETKWKLWQAIRVTVINCDFFGSCDNTHNTAFFYGADAVLDGCTATGAGNSAFSMKANKAVVKNCYANMPANSSIYSREGGEVAYCCFVNTTDQAAFGINKQTNTDSVHYPDRRIHHNIFVTNSSTYGAISYADPNDDTPEYYCDFNIYWNQGGSKLTSLGYLQSQTILAATQAFYGSSPYPFNDENSMVIDPGSSKGLYIDMDGDGQKEWIGIPQDGLPPIIIPISMRVR